MKRDKIIISENRVSVTGNNIWMSAAEIADLFNVTAASVNNAIRGILKTDILNDYEVCRTVRIDRHINLDVFNMELIVPLAYRFNTYYTALFRKWLVRKATTEAKEQPPIFLHLRSGFIC